MIVFDIKMIAQNIILDCLVYSDAEYIRTRIAAGGLPSFNGGYAIIHTRQTRHRCRGHERLTLVL